MRKVNQRQNILSIKNIVTKSCCEGINEISNHRHPGETVLEEQPILDNGSSPAGRRFWSGLAFHWQ